MSNQALITSLAEELVDELSSNDGAAEAYLAAAGRGNASHLLHSLDDIFDDGGEYRCERIIDPIADDLMDDGITFAQIENGAAVDDAHAVVEAAAATLRERR